MAILDDGRKLCCDRGPRVRAELWRQQERRGGLHRAGRQHRYGEGGNSSSSGGAARSARSVATRDDQLRSDVLGRPAQRRQLQRRGADDVPDRPGVRRWRVRGRLRQRSRQQQHLRVRVLRRRSRRHRRRGCGIGSAAGRVLRDVHREHVDLPGQHHGGLERNDGGRRDVGVHPERDGSSITYQALGTGGLQPGQVAILFVSQAPNETRPRPSTSPVLPV